MSHDNKGGSIDEFSHKKKVSEIYQSNKEYQAEQPSSQIDARIMALAKKQILKQSQVINKRTKIKVYKTWQWPVSLAASVGILGVLFITQREFFIQPNNIVVNDAGIVNEPVMGSPDKSAPQIQSEEMAVEQSFKTMKMETKTQNSKTLLDQKLTAVARTRGGQSETLSALTEQVSDSFMSEDKTVKTSPMSLSDMSKLADLLKKELAILNISKQELNTSSRNMQKDLFENLIQYQKMHEEFTITEKYLSVLTEQQVQQLTTFNIEADPEN